MNSRYVGKSYLLMSIFPMYIRPSLIGGSIVFWLYLAQVVSGLLLGLVYSWVFDVGLPGVLYLWWEVGFGSTLARLHSELGNLFFLALLVHVMSKFWTGANYAEADHTWISGSIILVFVYLIGITGAIMPCSILGEVTATVIGSAMGSLSFVRFDFLETPLLPGFGLTDETLSRVFTTHALLPLITFLVMFDHLSHLHVTEYTDEDEMEVRAEIRLEYNKLFLWIELYHWLEVLLFFLILRFLADSFLPLYAGISYTLSNFEYWPIQEEIDFVIAVPHWYLRPMMSCLVVIPHHYLGFFFVIFCFLFLIGSPLLTEDKLRVDSITRAWFKSRFPYEIDLTGGFMFYLFVCALAYTTLVVPTGRYFVSLGACELLIFSFWYIQTYLLTFFILGPAINKIILCSIVNKPMDGSFEGDESFIERYFKKKKKVVKCYLFDY